MSGAAFPAAAVTAAGSQHGAAAGTASASKATSLSRKELKDESHRLQTEANRVRNSLSKAEQEVAKEKLRRQETVQKDVQLRQSLEEQLEQERKNHERNLAKMQEKFAQHTEELQKQVRQARFADQGESRASASHGEEGNPDSLEIPPEPAVAPEPDELEAEAESGVAWRVLHDREEQRACLAREELHRITAEVNELKASTDEELRAAAEERQELLERRMAVDKLNEEKTAEIKETTQQSKDLEKKQDELERDAKNLQRQLSQAMYDVGKKDREQQLKETELNEVRRSIHTIQEEMDEVNRELQAQCGRVQRVESSLRLSRDLGSKVQTMREMLRESHEALGQLCGLVEQERAQRSDCSQGLRQQQMRTELLLQLLSHFKNRTQDLAPQVLLSQAAEFMQGQTGMVAPVATAPLPSEQTMASNLSAVPPAALQYAAVRHPI
jgi:hypothetical protein